jgi:hypothetical protein
MPPLNSSPLRRRFHFPRRQHQSPARSHRGKQWQLCGELALVSSTALSHSIRRRTVALLHSAVNGNVRPSRAPLPFPARRCVLDGGRVPTLPQGQQMVEGMPSLLRRTAEASEHSQYRRVKPGRSPFRSTHGSSAYRHLLDNCLKRQVFTACSKEDDPPWLRPHPLFPRTGR